VPDKKQSLPDVTYKQPPPHNIVGHATLTPDDYLVTMPAVNKHQPMRWLCTNLQHPQTELREPSNTPNTASLIPMTHNQTTIKPPIV
jgi:hypothetical protein